MKKILLVTSFNDKIYKLSGVRLLYTYLKYKIKSDLLITYEGNNDFLNDYLNDLNNSNIKIYNLNNDDFLNNWLKENEDIIPTLYNGKYKLYQFNNEIDIKLLNTFNQKMSLWFRKIASLNYALENYKNDYEHIIWIDADTFFLKYLPNEYMINLFNNTYCFYHLGLFRAIKTKCSIESGFIGFKKEKGYNLLQNIIDEYKNKKFMKYERWDDGHVIGQIIINSNIKSFDVINHNLKTMDVMDNGPLKDFIKHMKGTHHNIKKQIKNSVSSYKLFEIEIKKIIKNTDLNIERNNLETNYLKKNNIETNNIETNNFETSNFERNDSDLNNEKNNIENNQIEKNNIVINFLFSSITYLIYFIPLVIECKKNNIDYIFFIRNNQKNYADPLSNKNKKIFDYYVKYYNIQISKDNILKNGPIICVDGDIYGPRNEDKNSLIHKNYNKNKIYSLQENLNFIWNFDYYKDIVDYIIFPNENYAKLYNKISDKNLYIGNTKYDYILSTNDIYKKYNLDNKNKYVLILFPKQKYIKQYNIQYSHIINIYKHLDYLGYKILVKSRPKDKIIEGCFGHLSVISDRFPNETLELMKISELCVLFSSSAIEESIMMEIPTIDLKVDYEINKRLEFLYLEETIQQIDNWKNIDFNNLLLRLKKLHSKKSPIYKYLKNKYLFEGNISNNIISFIINNK